METFALVVGFGALLVFAGMLIFAFARSPHRPL